MLSRKNVGLASTCNTIGQTVGFFISQVGFLALYDPTVCNKYFRWVQILFSPSTNVMPAPECREVRIPVLNILLTGNTNVRLCVVLFPLGSDLNHRTWAWSLFPPFYSFGA